MTELEIKQIIEKSLGVYRGSIRRTPNGFVVEPGSMDIGYDALKDLSDKLGTTKINLDYEAGCGGYSEYTPGYPGNLTIAITIDPS